MYKRQGYYCGDQGYCTPEVGQTSGCTDSDGSDYYNAGHVTGYFDSVYGTYDDYCPDDGHVVEYTCSALSNEVVAQQITCPAGCSAGACYMP